MTEPKKDTEIEQALTRSDVLRARGYPDEVVDAHHSTPVRAVPLDQGKGDSKTNGTAPAKVRSCPVCGGPVPEDRKTTCSSPCATRFKGRDRRNGAVLSADKTAVPASDQSVTGSPATSPGPGLADAVAALVGVVGPLDRIDSLSVSMAGQVVTVTRAR